MHRSLHNPQSLNFLGFLLCLCSSCSQKEPLSCGSHGIFLGSFSPGVGGHSLVLDGTCRDCNNGVNSGDTLLMSLNAQQPSRHEDQGTEPPHCCLWVSFHPWDDFRGTEALQGAAGGAGLCTATRTPVRISWEKQSVHSSFSGVMCKIAGTTRKEKESSSFSSQAWELWYLRCSYPGVMAARRTLLNIFIHEKMLGFGSAELWVLLAPGRS